MNWRREWKPMVLIGGLFLVAYHFPAEGAIPAGPLQEGFLLLRSYAREHVLTCLLPAMFIAGAISVFLNKQAVLRYLGPGSGRIVSYGIASIAGGILAVCSCTVLPLFAGIYNLGAGLGPAITFLYAGPAINVLAITLSLRVFGLELGLARTMGAVVFGVVAGLAMEFMFRNGRGRAEGAETKELAADPPRTALLLAALLAILIFANLSPADGADGLRGPIYSVKWYLTAAAAFGMMGMLVAWYEAPAWQAFLVLAIPGLAGALCKCPQAAFGVGVACFAGLLAARGGELARWLEDSWSLGKLIFPMLAIGIFMSGVLFGTPGGRGLVPEGVVTNLIGGDGPAAIAVASLAGILMYFATLTEIPITQGLMSVGMGPGAALALLLAGPALSLPSLLVLRGVMGMAKTIAFAAIVAAVAFLAGTIFSLIA